jgi:hypothetical protein
MYQMARIWQNGGMSEKSEGDTGITGTHHVES